MPTFGCSRPPTGLRFYDQGDLAGQAAIELSDEGLRLDGRLVCAWPGGRWDQAHAANMVLGYRTVDAQDYRPCMPEDLPLISTWSDKGLGVAAIYIEVVARRGAIVESLWGARRVYLDLNTLPGDPREPIADAKLRMKGFLGWEWLRSGHEQRQQLRADFEQLLRQPDFREFVEGVRACLSSPRVPECLAPFVTTPFYHADAAAAIGKVNFVTAGELVRYLWTAKGESGGTRQGWQDVHSCLMAGEPVAVSPKSVQLSGAVLCNVTREGTRWKLSAFFERPTPEP